MGVRKGRAPRGRPVGVEPVGDAAWSQRQAGRPRDDTVRLTKAARERFERDLASNAERIFEALMKAAIGGDTGSLSLIVQRLIPIRRGAPVQFVTRPLKTPADCADAFGDILDAVGKGTLTPEEGDRLGALIERRIGLFHTVELQDEIAGLKDQLAALALTRPPGLRVVS